MAKESIEIYDRTYFEDGLATGKSLYNGYNWMPERSFAEAMAIIDAFGICREKHTILDFGTAKGFLVRAMRLLGRKAFGCDISRYAVCTADPDIRRYIRLSTEDNQLGFLDQNFYLIIAKDVLEHLSTVQLDFLLPVMHDHCKRLFVAVPLGEGGDFTVPEYNYDSTHVTAENEAWWSKLFQCHGFEVEFSFPTLEGMKENWRHYPGGNRFFGLRSL